MYAVGLSGVGSISGNCFVTERRERGRKGERKEKGKGKEGQRERKDGKGRTPWLSLRSTIVSVIHLSCMVSSHEVRCQTKRHEGETTDDPPTK